MLYLTVLLVLVGQCYAKLHNYENFDLESFLSNEAKAKAFLGCVSDDSKCGSQGDLEMKNDIVEMMMTSCAGCTEKEKEKYKEGLAVLQKSVGDPQTAMFNQFANLFLWGTDPEGKNQ
uniref:Chemosensory protein n=1 Tax=Cnaphalocrocis medinalis TaxID=437488 RepID=A0A0A1CNN3_CNAME|nr:chemosensory protein [Cnaphalocrocis medinalis]